MDVLYAFIKSQELRALIEPTSPRPDAATTIFNLPDDRVTGTKILACGLRSSIHPLIIMTGHFFPESIYIPSIRAIAGMSEGVTIPSGFSCAFPESVISMAAGGIF